MGDSMSRNLIVADDFTGANDTGVQLKRRGIETEVVLCYEEKNQNISCVIDTESRGLTKEEAYQKVLYDLSKVKFEDFQYVIKKVDSTLRGNIGIEVKAMDEMYQSDIILFMPAFPDIGRTTVGGVHRLHGVPIKETELAKDPKNPVLEDNLSEILKEAFEEEVFHISLEQIQNNEIDFNKGRIFVCDAVTNQDMKKVLENVKSLNKKILYVGAAAIADNLLELEDQVKPVLGVVGSLSSVIKQQLEYARNQGTKLVVVPIQAILSGEDKKVYVEEIIRLLENNQDAILLSSASLEREEYDQTVQVGRQFGITTEELACITRDIMADMVYQVLEKVSISGLFLTGGDTAIGVFKRLNAYGSKIVDEIEIGIPMMRLVGGKKEGLAVVTKAGAFGKENSIQYALRKLKERR